MPMTYTDEEIFSHLLDHDYRELMLAELYRYHRASGVPAKLAAYFIHRLECLLDQFDGSAKSPFSYDEGLKGIDYDFGYMGYFDRTLALVKEGSGPCCLALIPRRSVNRTGFQILGAGGSHFLGAQRERITQPSLQSRPDGESG